MWKQIYELGDIWKIFIRKAGDMWKQICELGDMWKRICELGDM